MKYAIAMLALGLPNALLAADDCTFDQSHQAAVIARIAEANPGGSADVENRLIAWTSKTEGTTTFGYGGCADLGSVVTRTTSMTEPRTQEQVLALARELATRFWSNDIVSAGFATETLLNGIDGSKYTIEEQDGRTTFNVQDPSYAQLYIEHEYKDGMDRVAIGWQGNF